MIAEQSLFELDEKYLQKYFLKMKAMVEVLLQERQE